MPAHRCVNRVRKREATGGTIHPEWPHAPRNTQQQSSQTRGSERYHQATPPRMVRRPIQHKYAKAPKRTGNALERHRPKGAARAHRWMPRRRCGSSQGYTSDSEGRERQRLVTAAAVGGGRGRRWSRDGGQRGRAIEGGEGGVLRGALTAPGCSRAALLPTRGPVGRALDGWPQASKNNYVESCIMYTVRNCCNAYSVYLL